MRPSTPYSELFELAGLTDAQIRRALLKPCPSIESTVAEIEAQLGRRLGAEDSSIDIMGMDVIWTGEFANAGWVEPWSGWESEGRLEPPQRCFTRGARAFRTTAR